LLCTQDSLKERRKFKEYKKTDRTADLYAYKTEMIPEEHDN